MSVLDFLDPLSDDAFVVTDVTEFRRHLWEEKPE